MRITFIHSSTQTPPLLNLLNLLKSLLESLLLLHSKTHFPVTAQGRFACQMLGYY